MFFEDAYGPEGQSSSDSISSDHIAPKSPVELEFARIESKQDDPMLIEDEYQEDLEEHESDSWYNLESPKVDDQIEEPPVRRLKPQLPKLRNQLVK